MKFRTWIVRQKLRFDIAGGAMNVFNFAMLLGMNNKKVCAVFHINETINTAVVTISLGILGLWMVGYMLDKYFKIVELYNRELNNRNEMMIEIHQKKK